MMKREAEDMTNLEVLGATSTDQRTKRRRTLSNITDSGEPITKDQRTSRRKRSEGIMKKAFELSQLPYTRVFIAVEWIEEQRMTTYDNTDGQFIEDYPGLRTFLVHCIFIVAVTYILTGAQHDYPHWDRRSPASYSRRLNKNVIQNTVISHKQDHPAIPKRRAPGVKSIPAPPTFDRKKLAIDFA
jgi:hypothetical protein